VQGTSDFGTGVEGTSNDSNGTGVFGSGYGVGVLGSSSGIGVRGESSSNTGVGVSGAGFGSDGTGVRGEALGNYGTGVYGTGGSAGMHGYSSIGVGVRGVSDANYSVGVIGISNSTTGAGVRGDANGNGYGVYGNSSTGTGVVGSSVSGTGMYGVSYATSNGIGVIGEANSGTGAIAVDARSNEGTGIYARGGTRAGYFQGNVNITGNLSKGGGSFKIDHPLDPANKYLYHSFVESPDMMDIYNGNITTDGRGEAVVTMPAWFEALNRDFRYQLTVMGQFAQAIVSSEMKDNHFTIKTDKAGVKVSWMVTGIRKDPYAEQHRIPVEQDKSAEERGYYLYPDVYGQPNTMSVDKNTREQASESKVALPGGK
jgi:hypothetical protein